MDQQGTGNDPGGPGRPPSQPPLVVALLALGAVAALVGAGLVVLHRVGGQPAASPTRSSTSPSPSTASGTPLPTSPPPLSPKPSIAPLPGGSLHSIERSIQRVLQQVPSRPTRKPRTPTTFTISSFNQLGFSHTTRSGTHHGYANGRKRMHDSVAELLGHGVSVAGLQEFQAPQFRTLEALAGRQYDVYPGLSAGRAAVQNSIIWRRADWRMLSGSTVRIPYFHGRPMPMPYVLLENRHTHQQVWFANYHNPADVYGPAQRFRNAATRIETRLFRTLVGTGRPLLVTGDMNERGSYFCRLTRGVAMHSANGAVRNGGCRLPARTYVDWILGSPGVQFTGFDANRDPLVRRTSDHPMMLASVRIEPGSH
ncbi:MAG: endonuclease/exonuclease/phosphatase family protein [Marmoricola sp.]